MPKKLQYGNYCTILVVTKQTKTTTMTTQINNIAELAAQLVIEGKATFDNAIEMAINQDNKRCINAIEDMDNMKRGYITEHNKTLKAYKVLLNSTYVNLH